MNDDSTGLGESPANIEGIRATSEQSRQINRENSSIGVPFTPIRHPGYGVTTEQLADAQRRFTNYARYRIMGTGNREYGRGSKQAFEDMSYHRLIDELRDEIADAVNYLAFLDIQLSRWKSTLEDKL